MKMIQIDNKFEVGQKVHMIGKKRYSQRRRITPRWIVKTTKGCPLKITGINYTRRLENEEIKYIISGKKVRENLLFANYEEAEAMMQKYNEEKYLL